MSNVVRHNPLQPHKKAPDNLYFWPYLPSVASCAVGVFECNDGRNGAPVISVTVQL